MDDILFEVSGRIENVVYRNEKNDYTVLEIADESDNLITCVGMIPLAFEGERVTLKGKWVYHKEFGRQFEFSSFEKNLPEDVDGILQYLSSRTVKGVGPVTALKIVNRFGSESFDVIENHPEWLTDIQGITMKKAAAISESFREQSGIRGVMMFCKDYLGTSEVTKVYKSFGSGAVGIIKDNPYILCEAPCALPFDKVDVMAASFGYDMNSRNRILSGAKHSLAYNAGTNGHTCLPIDKLVPAVAQNLEITAALSRDMIDSFIRDEELSYYKDGDVTYVMTNEVSCAETIIAAKFADLSESAGRLSVGDVATLIEKVESDSGLEYAQGQRMALIEALTRGVIILTGGPGTGKTTVVKALVSIFASLQMKTVLSAPTGRAAKRLSEATGCEAKTIHRMLEMEKSMTGELNFCRNERNPLTESVIIVDESSMIDLELLQALLRAIRRGARLILIGDTDQLPSVGAGNVLSDLIASERIPTIRLTEIFRQSGESMIVTNAHKINMGEKPNLSAVDSDFFFVGRQFEKDIPGTVTELVLNRLPRRYGRDIADGIQVITPSKKGFGGVDILNVELQNRINPQSKFKREKNAHGVCFREGDKVMQMVNNYELVWEKNGVEGNGMFNGDIGVIETINLKDENMRIRFDDKVASYPFDKLDELELAYAITVHKSQGSEYPIVILPMYSCPPMLKTRNLLYTAITRAKRMVILVGRPEIVGEMVANSREMFRYTTLKQRLCDYI